MEDPHIIQNAIVDEFAQAGDALNQFTCLIEYASTFPELPEAQKNDEALVRDCQSRVWLHLQAKDGHLSIEADSDTLMVRGVLGIVRKMFDGQPLAVVAATEVDFIARTELAQVFDSKRVTGIKSIVAHIKEFVRSNAEEGAAMPHLKERMEQAEIQAEKAVAALQRPGITEEAFDETVHEYVRCKFLLDREECTSDVILDLAETSIEKILRENDRSVKLAQASTTCTNQSSTDVKKVLLSLSLQRALGVTMSPEESAGLETVSHLSGALYHLVSNKGSGRKGEREHAKG